MFFKVRSQNFIPGYNGSKAICGVTGFKEDTINDKLYMYGNILNTPCGLNYNYIACNQNGIWSFSGSFNHSISSFEIFNNELYACGWFSTVNGQPISSLAKYNGSSWVAVPGFLSAVNLWRLKVINNELYVCGGTINTTNGNYDGLAKFDGTNWLGFSVPYLGDPGAYIQDVEMYNNDLFVGGNFNFPDGTRSLAYYHNGQWQKPGNGISGSICTVERLQYYKNVLYIGGLIFKSSTNVGNMLIAWDGNNLISVGDGLKDNLNTYGSAQVHDMMIYKNKLYIAGTFNYAGNIFSAGLTIFDGNTFYSLNKTPQLSSGLSAIGQYKDTLWISGGQKYLNDSIKNIGKYVGNGVYDTSSVFYDVGIRKNILPENISVFPNPSTSIVNINDEQNQLQNATIQIKNNLGQLVYTSPFASQINLSNLSAGMYFLIIEDKHIKKTMKIIKQ